MLNKLSTMKNKKGFTLVEVIVVLVILAIMAAILIPSLTGYIDKANEKRVIAEARALYIAAQTELSEQYAATTAAFTGATITYVKETDPGDGTLDEAILNLSELDIDDFGGTVVYDGNATITKVTYTSGKYTATFENSAWSITH